MRQFVLNDDKTPLVERAETVLDGLNPSQRAAAETVDGPVMIVAGAGSGKTRTLTYRIAYLLATGKARPQQILALTFTNKAAREMVERIRALVGDELASGLWMGTFHSIFSRILRREGPRLGFTSDYSIYDTEDTERVIKVLSRNYSVDERQFTPRAIRSRISKAKNDLVTPEDFARTASSLFEEKVALLFRPYQDELRRSNAMDFDDLLLNPIRLFEEHPDVLERYQARWQYIHIDEYQDTNRAQYVVTRQLAAAHGNLCVVGDDAQSIYAFRGADIRNILNFEQDQQDVKLVRLEQNYRSTKRILQLADSVIKHNRGQIEKTLWTDNPVGEHIVVIEALSEKDEAQKIQQIVRDLHLRSSYTFGDFAVLYRTNAQSRSLEDALRRASIPYEIIGGVNFYQRREIKDALAYLRVVVNPKDNESLRRVINYPTRGIGNRTIEAVNEFAAREDVSLWEAVTRVEEIDLSTRAKSAVTVFKELIERHAKDAASKPADEVARALIQETGILTNLRDENTIEGLARWENVQELISAIAEFVASGSDNQTLSGFLQEVSLITNVDTARDSDQQVKLMTLHSSKGLEFPVVCIAGLEEGLFPLQASTMDPADLEEERRLLYVGITRAKEHLFLSSARSRFRFGQSQSSGPSRFLEEMDTSVLRSETGRDYNDSPAYAHLPHRRQFTRREPAGTHPRYADSFDEESDEDGVVERDPTPPDAIVAGMRVEHQLFGSGKVLTVEGAGDQARATVFFKRAGQKKLVLKFAKLKQII